MWADCWLAVGTRLVTRAERIRRQADGRGPKPVITESGWKDTGRFPSSAPSSQHPGELLKAYITVRVELLDLIFSPQYLPVKGSNVDIVDIVKPIYLFTPSSLLPNWVVGAEREDFLNI